LVLLGESTSEIDGRSRFANAAFLIGDRNNFHLLDWGAHAPRVLTIAPSRS
jgi:hypothetical protein